MPSTIPFCFLDNDFVCFSQVAYHAQKLDQKSDTYKILETIVVERAMNIDVNRFESNIKRTYK